MSDIKKVQKAMKGNHKAFQELMVEQKVKLYKIAFMYVKNEEDAIEVFQETIYKALISIKNLKDERYFLTWLTRILINTALDLIKKKSRVVPMDREVLENKVKPYITPENEIDLLKAVMELDEKYKSVIVLRYYQDYSIKQIAEILECPEGTIKTNIHRGLMILRKTMKEDCVNE